LLAQATDIEDPSMNSSQGQSPDPSGNDREDDDEPWRHPPIASGPVRKS